MIGNERVTFIKAEKTMKNVLLMSLLALLVVSCGSKDDEENEAPQNNNPNPVNVQNCRDNNYVNQRSIYDTTGYCLNGQWVSTNTNTGHTGYWNNNNSWVNTGPYYLGPNGNYMLFSPYDYWHYPYGGGYYRYQDPYSNSWRWTWRSWD